MDAPQLPVVCAKCHNGAKKTYNCDHTDYAEYCAECYTELHYYLTEPGQGQDPQGASGDGDDAP
ncbi:MAG: hypothetical protein OXP12_04210 [Thaumarchaeota archaeon]|nr:hypothetical protein [Nitrososphaerota archaeon]MDE0265876.1 hypothetical protein [Nitrososphaerota archaeon]MDE0526362.1 hypothetical protein [Nitrososphaerota archaeon]